MMIYKVSSRPVLAQERSQLIFILFALLVGLVNYGLRMFGKNY